MKTKVTKRAASKPAKPPRKETKIMKTIRLDRDVLRWVQEEGAVRGLPYQTVINSILREMMLLTCDQALHAQVKEAIRAVYLARAKKI